MRFGTRARFFPRGRFTPIVCPRRRARAVVLLRRLRLLRVLFAFVVFIRFIFMRGTPFT
jgi:hypothetical protein